MADKDQIAGLSEYARDPSLSFYAEKAQDYPSIKSTAEAVMQQNPDLILGNPFGGLQTRARLEQLHYRIVDVPPADDFDAIVRQTHEIADAIGHPERGNALVASMQEALTRIPRMSSGKRASILYYQRRGFVSGSDTLIDDMMQRVGLLNMARRMGERSVVHVDLEAVIAANPKYLLMTTDVRPGSDMGEELLDHPVLRQRYGQGRILHMPESLAVCGGPSYPAAIAALAEQLKQAH